MSYDISVLSRAPGLSIAKAELTRQLTQLGWRADSPNHFLWVGPEGVVVADMDLAWAENGDYQKPGDVVNCLQVHIPYGFLESSRAEILNQCRKVAEALDWRIYDEQEGSYLR